ncbi:MAG: hypothetical protein PQ612_06130 [Rickettsiales bacterium]|nr:hypothetical protein [Pseudomonadota bacterium]MDA0966549.1 hypothetical protein [Pseudomonadota bacterium]MDG4543578.1 hypothetical protein [Rickettsiales bacterium]MDG4545725.1 hypothetical protein [Rickettsiales bacterium]MDG4547502.1 hypothetical protein [Rickettsiales bacterium]
MSNNKYYPIDEVQKLIDNQHAPNKDGNYVLSLGQLHYLIEAIQTDVFNKNISESKIHGLMEFIDDEKVLSPDNWTNIAQYCCENSIPYKEAKDNG